MTAEIKLLMMQIETAKMAAASLQVNQLATTEKLSKLSDAVGAAIKALQDEIAAKQFRIESR